MQCFSSVIEKINICRIMYAYYLKQSVCLYRDTLTNQNHIQVNQRLCEDVWKRKLNIIRKS